MHILMRASFSPNDAVAQAKHFMQLQADIGPWLSDYVNVQSLSDPEPEPSRFSRSTTRELLNELCERIEINIKPGVDCHPLLVRLEDLSAAIVRCVDGGLDYMPCVDKPATAIVGGDTPHP